jgi:hypothetical protein
VSRVDAVRKRVLADHRETVAAVGRAADAAAADLATPATRAATVAALREGVGDDVRAALVDVLRGAVDATGRDLQAEPVPASPYVVVTARGPLLRATVADGRLVVLLRAFDRSDGGYVRADAAPESAVEVRFRRRP